MTSKNPEGLSVSENDDGPVVDIRTAVAKSGVRLQSLDVLRAIAVLLVLGRHMPPLSNDVSQLGGIVLLLWRNGGWIGVDLFFVLSGFLVSGLLFSEYRKNGSITIKRFLIRRGLKLYPAFYVMLICMCGVIYYRNGYVPINGLLSEAFFLQSYFPGLAGHTWSLGVEEHFYLLLPLVLAAFVKKDSTDRPFRWIPGLFAVIAVTLLGLRIVNAMNVPYSHETHLFPTHLRFDSLLFGVLLSYFHQFHAESFIAFCRRNRGKLACFGVVGFVPFFLLRLETSSLVYSVGLSILYVCSGALLMSALVCEPRAGKSPLSITRCLAWIGYHSYSIYLWHLLVLSVLLPASVRLIGQMPGPEMLYAMYVVEAIAFGIVAARIIEVPVLRIRDRLWPSLTGGAIQQVAAKRTQPVSEISEPLLPSIKGKSLHSAGS